MSKVGTYDPKEFEADYPEDFGSNVRGSYFEHEGKRAGMLLAHVKSDGTVCAGSVWFVPYRDGSGRDHPTWEVVSEDPLTLSPSIQCDCGLHGFIENGRWHT